VNERGELQQIYWAAGLERMMSSIRPNQKMI